MSIATVSRVLRRPESVREETRQRVLDVVQQLGYVPSASARGLAGKRTGVIGLLLPDHDDPEEAPEPPVPSGGVAFIDDREGGRVAPHNLYYDEILRGTETAAWRAGYALMVTAGRGMSRDLVLSDIAGRVDALAIVSRAIPDELILRTATRLPIVVLAGDVPGDGVDHVSVDNRGGMRALTEHVLAVKPPGSLLYLDGPDGSPDAEARRAGFRDAVSADADVHYAAADFAHAGGRRATAHMLASAVPGAVVAANDQSALGALDALAAAGVDVPRRCVVTGFDGIDAGRYARPALTTVRQPMALLGETAVEMVRDRLAHPGSRPRSRELPVAVLLRESCPPLR